MLLLSLLAPGQHIDNISEGNYIVFPTVPLLIPRLIHPCLRKLIFIRKQIFSNL